MDLNEVEPGHGLRQDFQGLHTLRVEFSGTKIRVLLNGKLYIEAGDEHIKEAGAVGVWTKADSVTWFDNVSYGAP